MALVSLPRFTFRRRHLTIRRVLVAAILAFLFAISAAITVRWMEWQEDRWEWDSR